MATQERRNFMALDDAYAYCRLLEARAEGPSLYLVCSAIRTVDKALEVADDTPNSWASISIEAWSKIRDSLYNTLVTSFPGYFLVYGENSDRPLEPESS